MKLNQIIKCFILLGVAGSLLGSMILLGMAASVGDELGEGRCASAAAKMQAEQAAATVHFLRENPASLKPVLTWTKVTGSVAYEFELLREAPQASGQPVVCFSTKQIYVNGYHADLSAYTAQPYLYWRVRGLDIEGQPIGSFSEPEKIYIDKNKPVVQSPIPTSVFHQVPGASLLYPVYAWIPLNGAAEYEVEILDALPENPQGIEPSRHRVDAMIAQGFDYYDDVPRISEKTLYWRVRGLDQAGNPVGVYSEAKPFNIDMKHHTAVAAYGDSITHGGGSISYSPADWEYSYQYYLDFPTINLARSGDTSESMVERFEQDVVPFHPQYLLILAGSNSLRGSATARSVIDDLVVLRAKCLAHQIQPVFLTIPPIHPENIERAFQQDTAADWREKIWLVNQFIRTQQHIDIAGALENGNGMLPEQFAVDGLHPDPAGKKRMAAAINAQWKEVICGKSTEGALRL